ncbi:MAG: multidrug ABC transporter ATP-binding protein [Cytophagaceae bacterium SCN 52-12]|nr:MAG: multidrug ABC transporter ATP-binding protein [Cytophagaceae bacterium SCN 52-12]
MAKRREFKSPEDTPDDSEVSFFATKPIRREGLKKTLKIFRYTLPYRNIFLLGFVFLILATGTSLVFPKAVGEIVEVLQGGSKYTLNQIISFLFGILVLQAVFSFFRIFLFTRVSERAMADVRKDLYSKIICLPITFFETNRVGELTSRVTSDVSYLDNVLSFTLAEFFRQGATLIIGTVFLLYTSAKLTLFMLATFPLLVFAAVFFGRYIRRLSKHAQTELARANVVVEETFQNVHTVKAFTNESLEIKRYGSSLDRVVSLLLEAATYRGFFVSFLILVMFGGIVCIVWFGASLIQAGELSVSDLFTFVIYTAYIGGALNSLGDMYAQINRTIGASERVLEILEEEPELDLNAGRAQSYQPVTGSIVYDNVRFSYPSRKDVEVLKGINMTVRPGERIALVGHSGAGKSTIIQLLMRFYETDGGAIRIDGKPVSDFNLHELRKNIAIVPQEVILFGGTILENISYGKPGASFEEVHSAARKANALQFIESFPEKFDTVVGERGIKLSGGQRQRIAIARAILKDPKILILDEATSSLDAESEKLVQEALNELMKNRTTLVIAHRLATINKVDKIYVIRDGVIAESGTHTQLTAIENGLYANLIRLQFEAVTEGRENKDLLSTDLL